VEVDVYNTNRYMVGDVKGKKWAGKTKLSSEELRLRENTE
jgi:hypothetical protein